MQNQAYETGTQHSDQPRHAAPVRRTASGAIDTEHYTRLARTRRAAHVHGILRGGLRYLAEKLSPVLRAMSRSGSGAAPRKLGDRSWSSCHD
ncbi:MAG: hypothetical protein HY274_10670 [Gammaproteobacteria bacterium]|nr:hypothetical protein [Gammaproteobacteria bacterium]